MCKAHTMLLSCQYEKYIQKLFYVFLRDCLEIAVLRYQYEKFYFLRIWK